MRTEKAITRLHSIANHLESLQNENDRLSGQVEKLTHAYRHLRQAWRDEKLSLLRRYDPAAADNFEMLRRTADQERRGFTCGRCKDTNAPGCGAVCWNCEPPEPDQADTTGWDMHGQHLSGILTRYAGLIDKHLKFITGDTVLAIREFLKDLHHLKDTKTPHQVEYLGPIPKGLESGILADLLRFHAELRECRIIGWPEVTRG